MTNAYKTKLNKVMSQALDDRNHPAFFKSLTAIEAANAADDAVTMLENIAALIDYTNVDKLYDDMRKTASLHGIVCAAMAAQVVKRERHREAVE